MLNNTNVKTSIHRHSVLSVFSLPRFQSRLIKVFGFACALSMGSLAFSEQGESTYETMAEATLESSEQITVIDINTADAKQLASLSNIGLKKAEEIIQYRTQNGLFNSIDDLKKVKGVGDSTIEKNRHRIHVASK